MKITLIAVSGKAPAWVEYGEKEYLKRLPRDFSLEVVQVPMAPRSRSSTIDQCIRKESEAMLRLLKPRDHVVALDERGKLQSTARLAERFRSLSAEGAHLSMLVGGPDGLGPRCLQRADETWSLSPLTLPHPLVRVVVAEQVYRVWSLLSGHPYHRA